MFLCVNSEVVIWDSTCRREECIVRLNQPRDYCLTGPEVSALGMALLVTSFKI